MLRRELPSSAKRMEIALENTSAAVAGGCRELATAELWLTSDSRRRHRLACVGAIGRGISPAAAVAGGPLPVAGWAEAPVFLARLRGQWSISSGSGGLSS